MEYLQQLDIVSVNKWLQILSLSNQELHPTGVSFEHDFVCNVLKPTPLYSRKPSPWFRMGRHRARTSVVAYADDVTIFVTTPTDITKLHEAIHCFEAASGARVNTQKPRAIAFWSWDKSIEIMNIPYHDTATILGFQIKNTVGESALASWTKTTAKIRAHAQEAYC